MEKKRQQPFLAVGTACEIPSNNLQRQVKTYCSTKGE